MLLLLPSRSVVPFSSPRRRRRESLAAPLPRVGLAQGSRFPCASPPAAAAPQSRSPGGCSRARSRNAPGSVCSGQTLQRLAAARAAGYLLPCKVLSGEVLGPAAAGCWGGEAVGGEAGGGCSHPPVLPAAEPRLYQEIRERGLNSVSHESDEDLLEEPIPEEPSPPDAAIVVQSYRPAQVTWSQLPEVGAGAQLLATSCVPQGTWVSGECSPGQQHCLAQPLPLHPGAVVRARLLPPGRFPRPSAGSVNPHLGRPGCTSSSLHVVKDYFSAHLFLKALIAPEGDLLIKKK